jgi:hypothetical protein
LPAAIAMMQALWPTATDYDSSDDSRFLPLVLVR